MVDTITLDLLIENTPIEVDVPGIGIVKYKMPTRGDRLEAEKRARKHPYWKEMEEIEKTDERVTQLVLQILVEPRITPEQYMNAREDYMEAIIQAVSVDLVKRLEELRRKRSKLINDFLELMKERVPGISTGYSSRETLTGKKLEKSTTT